MNVRKCIECTLIIGIILFLFLTFQASMNDHALAIDHNGNEQKSDIENKQNQQKLQHEDIIRLTEEFMEILVQEADQNNKVIQFATKKDLIEAFEDIAPKEIVQEYVNFYYQENPNGLYIVPTELPPWFNSENDYNMVQLDKTRFKIMQKNSSDLHGDYTIKIEFTYNVNWKITNIDFVY